MANEEQPAAKYIKNQLQQNFPIITKVGILDDRYVAGTEKKSVHAQGRAVDIYLSIKNDEERNLADLLFKAFISHGPTVGIYCVIWNHKMWSTKLKKTEKYWNDKLKPHTDHIHIEILTSKSSNSPLVGFESMI
ncbi:MAG: hypothetical protein ABI855_08265, partial [Bacteroidota bacterium]